MQKRHVDRKKYFLEQVYTTEKYVLPYIQDLYQPTYKVLEIGCGEAGNLKPFLDLGCECLGVDLDKDQINRGRLFFENHPNNSRLTLISKNIYDFDDFSVKYDLIMMRDVIEHIHNQEIFIKFLQNFMHSNSVVFFAFPPWQNPFGGHQQICKSKLLSKLPFFHLLPKQIYKRILKIFGETDSTIEGLLEIKETGISIERFEKIIKSSGLEIAKSTYYFINPNYEIKFGLKPRKIFRFIACIPIVRNFFITCGYYLVTNKKSTLL